MTSKRRPVPAIAVFLFVLLASGTVARAYIDPGTGSYAVQILIAFFLAALFSLKVFWKKIRVVLRSTFSKKKQPGGNAQ